MDKTLNMLIGISFWGGVVVGVGFCILFNAYMVDADKAPTVLECLSKTKYCKDKLTCELSLKAVEKLLEVRSDG